MSDFLAPEPELRRKTPRRISRCRGWSRLWWSLALLAIATWLLYFNGRGAVLEFLCLRDGIPLRGVITGTERHAKSWNVYYRFRAPDRDEPHGGQWVLPPDQARGLPVGTPIFVRFHSFSPTFSWHVARIDEFGSFNPLNNIAHNLAFCLLPFLLWMLTLRLVWKRDIESALIIRLGVPVEAKVLDVRVASYRLAGELRSSRIVLFEWTQDNGGSHQAKQATSNERTPLAPDDTLTALVWKARKTFSSAQIYVLSDYRAL